MQHNSAIDLLATKVKLSTLWIVVLFSMVFRDLHEFLRTGYLEEMLAMTSNGAEVSQAILVAAAIVLLIPIGLIFLTQVLSVKVNRMANMAAAVFMIGAIVSNNLSPDFDDMLFYGVGCAALVAIFWYARGWSEKRAAMPANKIAPSSELTPSIPNR